MRTVIRTEEKGEGREEKGKRRNQRRRRNG